MLRWEASNKQTLTWSKTGSIHAFLIIQFDSENYCDIRNCLAINQRESINCNNNKKLKQKKNTDAAIRVASSK